jgi:hypothetical protein
MLGMMRATMDASRDDALGPEMLRRESACIMRFCIYRILEVSLNHEVFREYTTSCHART